MPRNRKTLAIVAAVVLVLGVAAALALQSGHDEVSPPAGAASAAPKAALTVTLVAPQSGQWPQSVAANGNITAWQEASIGAEAQGLRLVEVLVNVGDRVKRGQALARFASTTMGAEVAAARANLAEAQAGLAEAQANAERARALQASGAISAQQIQQYVTGEATARARVAALKARLDADQERLAQTRIVAPDDGVISARMATVGSVVAPGQELFRLVRQNRLEWRADVPAAELAKIRPGMTALVTPPGGRAAQGKVRMVAPTVDPATRNGIVYVDLPNPGDARAGMFARGDIQIGTAQGLTLPQAAVLLREGFSYVFKVGPDDLAPKTPSASAPQGGAAGLGRPGAVHRVQQVKVSTGRRIGERIEITGGLAADARVVEQGGGFLADGDTVRVVSK